MQDILITISTVQKLLIRYGKLVNVEIHTFISVYEFKNKINIKDNSYRYQRQDSLQYKNKRININYILIYIYI